ncbi:MAG: hypothetical protein L0229_25350 [Blastocatellia bacterium]|nr:hypothetical protein [Blastocatellia bacterium]
MRKDIPEKEIKILFAKSGNLCAFPGCGTRLIESETLEDAPAVVGEIAHIVADSRQGPRGNFPLSNEDRQKHPNLILLCRRHHSIIDKQKRTYSVQVLRQMKADHEALVERKLSADSPALKPPIVSEDIHSTLVSVTDLPRVVFSAPCSFSDSEEAEVKNRIKYPEDRFELTPFFIRENRLFAFHALWQEDNPFARVIDCNHVKPIQATEMWSDPENKRRYVTLLNRALYKYTARLGIRFDPEHRRYYFEPEEKGTEREVKYRSMNKKTESRLVVWQPKKKSTGEPKNFWWHLAAKLVFHQFADQQWCLSIRPERRLTKDSLEPLPPEKIGRKVTRLKAKMYNDLYIAEVVFWRDYLSRGEPRFILNFGAQSAVIKVELIKVQVEWAGIPSDNKPFRNQVYAEDLFTFAALQQARAGEEIEWEEFEYEAEGEEAEE